jgi:hypothetical protein
MHNGAHNFMVTLISDTILLFTMLVGLFRVNKSIHGSFGLGRLLWKQVRFLRFSNWALSSTARFVRSAFQGIIWLLLAAAVEIPPVVRLLTSQLSFH